MLSLGETTEAVVVWHLCSLEKLLNMPCSFLDCCPFPGFRILGTSFESSHSSSRGFQPPALPDYIHRWVNEFRSNNPNLGDIIDL